jgi:NitT/TauT family transport system substrate-binding protein
VPVFPVRSRSRLLALVALSLLVAVLAAACGSTSAKTTAGAATKGGSSGTLAMSGAPVTVRLGYYPNVTHAPALVGVQEGLFKAALPANVTLETKTFNAGPAAVEALFGDALDITYIGPNPTINAYQKSNGEAVRIVAGSTSGGAYFVVKPEITSAQDLKGKTVASPQLGNTQDVALRRWLKSKGLATDTAGGGDVNIKPQENADTLTAFKAGDIAGAWVPEPWATRLIQEGGGKVLVDEKTLWPQGQFVTTQIIVRTKFLDEHPDVVQAILAGHLAALAAIEADPTGSQKAADDAIEAVTQKRLSDKVIAAAWKNLDFTYDPLSASLQQSAQAAEDVGVLKHVDLNGIYSLDILNNLLTAQAKPTVSGL